MQLKIARLAALGFFIFGLNGPVTAAELVLDSKIHDTKSVEFIPYEAAGPWGSYLAMNLPFEPVAELFKQLLLKERRQLANRGEAHITVVTPVEYWNVLKPKGVTIEAINQIAKNSAIQKAKFEVVCLGRGAAKIDGADEATFYVVVKSKDLVEIRSAIQAAFVAKGGDAKAFLPSAYHPHITLGFTKRDLHESDGVIKDEKSCVSKL
ncbi:MAG: 2'-5' RNA ligase family protein [Bdellovibrionota bacterium]